MKRTINLKFGMAYYRNVKLGNIVGSLLNHFKMPLTCRFAVTIVENPTGNYRIFESHGEFYCIRTKGEYGSYVGLICKYQFKKLFFVPQKNKRYDIIVKKVRKVKR